MKALELQECVVSTDLSRIIPNLEDTPSVPVGRYTGFEQTQQDNPVIVTPSKNVRQFVTDRAATLDSTIYDSEIEAEALRLWLATIVAPHDDISYINSLHDDRYELIQSIPVKIERDPEVGWAAWFEEAQIAMPGTDPNDAKQALADSIVDTFEDLSLEVDDLGPHPLNQLRVLRYFLRERVKDADDSGSRGENSK